MSVLELGPQGALYYQHQPPTGEAGCTFVFFNALTGDTSNWEAVIAPMLRDAGHGTLTFNYRGQADTRFDPKDHLGTEQIVQDSVALLAEVKPLRPVLVGLSIGGLFAAKAILAGAKAKALVLVNTLRKDTPRLRWTGDALVRAAEVGGLDLFRDLFLQLLCNQDWIKENRPNFLTEQQDYQPLDPDSGHYKLLAEAGRDADWNFPWERLKLPVLVITGLQDHIFLEPIDVAELYARLPRATRRDMPDAGHLIPAERPEKLAQELLNFAGQVQI